MNEFFTPSGAPSTGSAGASATMRNELQLVEDGFDKFPVMSTAQGKLLRVNAGGTAIVADIASAALATLAVLATAADKTIYSTALNTWAETALTAFARSLLDDANAAAARATLDVPSNAEAVLDTIFNAKGDLLVASAADTPAIETAGADGTVLTADSTQANGIKWAPQSQAYGSVLYLYNYAGGF